MMIIFQCGSEIAYTGGMRMELDVTAQQRKGNPIRTVKTHGHSWRLSSAKREMLHERFGKYGVECRVAIRGNLR